METISGTSSDCDVLKTLRFQCLLTNRTFYGKLSGVSVKLWDLMLKWLYHSEIWQLSQQQCYWDNCHISERSGNRKLISCNLNWGIIRFYNKMFYCLVTKSPDSIQMFHVLSNEFCFSCPDWMMVRDRRNVFEIYNNAWVTVNNHFWVMSEAICQKFSRVMKSLVKIVRKSYHEWPEISLFMVTNVLFNFLHTIFSPEHTILLKTIIDRWFRHCS